jgi:hypothetical protein
MNHSALRLHPRASHAEKVMTRHFEERSGENRWPSALLGAENPLYLLLRSAFLLRSK